jgi:hypothetical protein
MSFIIKNINRFILITRIFFTPNRTKIGQKIHCALGEIWKPNSSNFVKKYFKETKNNFIVGPLGLFGLLGPFGPLCPFGPLGPFGPFGTFGPLGPFGTFGPFGPLVPLRSIWSSSSSKVIEVHLVT